MTSLSDLDRAIRDEGGNVPCQNAPEMFFESDDVTTKQFTIARKLCAGCPVKNVCLSYALDNYEPFGVWGGLSTRERKELLRRAG